MRLNRAPSLAGTRRADPLGRRLSDGHATRQSIHNDQPRSILQRNRLSDNTFEVASVIGVFTTLLMAVSEAREFGLRLGPRQTSR